MFRKILNTGLFRFIGLVLAFVTGIIISRVFGAVGKGEITLFLLIPTLISTYFGLSIQEGFLYFFGLNKISNKGFKNLLFRISIFLIPVFVFFYFTAYLFIDKYDYYLFPQIILMIVLLYATIFKFSLRGLLEFKAYNLVLFFEPFITLLGVLIIVFFDLNLEYIIWAYILGYLLPLPYKYLIIINKEKTTSVVLKLKQIVNYSYKVHFFKILNFTENKFDILIIGYFLSITEVGIYSIAVAITVIFQSLVQTSISTVLLPELIKSKSDLKPKLTIDYFKLSQGLALVFLVGILIFGKMFIENIYGLEFEAAFTPLIILSIGALMKSPSACMNSFFKSNGRPDVLYKTSIYSVIVNVLLCFILIPSFGIVGAAIASSISYFIYGIIMIIKFKNTNQISILNLIIINRKDLRSIKNLIQKRR